MPRGTNVELNDYCRDWRMGNMSWAKWEPDTGAVLQNYDAEKGSHENPTQK